MCKPMLSALVLLAACDTGVNLDDSFDGLADLDEKSDAFSYRVKKEGSLQYGETSHELTYLGEPRFSEVSFAGKSGDHVDIAVRSQNGDPRTWLLDGSYRVLTYNDNESESRTNSRIRIKLPSSKNDIYRIVFRECALQPATFVVALKGPVPAGPTECANDPVCSDNPHAASWTYQSTGQKTYFSAVWGARSDDVYVGGVSGIWHSTGDGKWLNQWKQATSQTHTAIYGLWGSRATDVYAAAYEDTQNHVGQVLHSKGDGVWRVELDDVAAALHSVWGASSTSVYAVGTNGTILHSVGDGKWLVQTSGTTRSLNKVWGSGSSDVYAVGEEGTILHSTGEGVWSAQTSGTTEGISGIWGSSATDLYAVGQAGEILHSTGNGNWTLQFKGTEPQDFQAVWGSSAGNVYVVGTKASILRTTGDSKWTPQAVPMFVPAAGEPPVATTTLRFSSIWGTGPGDIYIAGSLGRVMGGQ